MSSVGPRLPTARWVARAAREASAGARVAIGPGLPDGLEAAVRARGGTVDLATPDLAFLGALEAGPAGVVPAPSDAGPGVDLLAAVRRARRVVAVFRLGEGGAALLRRPSDEAAPLVRAAVWVTDLSVFEVRADRVILRELAQGVTARDIQGLSEFTLAAAPGLAEVR